MSLETESDEEEFLVYANFDPHITAQDLDSEPKIKVIGIDEENPIIEINGKIFECSYDFSIGTNLFFEKDLNPPKLDPLYDKNPKEMYKFSAKTTKILKAKRIFVEKISHDNESNQDINVEENINFTELQFDLNESYPNVTYEQALEKLAKSVREFSDEEDEEVEMNIDSEFIKDDSEVRNLPTSCEEFKNER